MAKKISRNEIAESDIFGDIKSSAEETIGVIDKLSQALNETAEAVKKSVGGAKFDSSKAVDNFVKSTEKANKLQKQAIELDTTRAKAVLARKKAMEGQQRVLQQQEKTVQQRIKTEETMARQKARLNKEGERAARVARAENSEYSKLVKKTRDLKNASKELAASMIKLESTGRKNTTAYREMARQYKSVTKEAKSGDKTLKKIDSTVGDNFRNVGNYTGALKKLGRGMAQLAGGFGVLRILRGATDIVVNFDQAVADLGAISADSTSKELEGLTAQAKELGATTQFSATQITEMQIELAKLGFTADQIDASTNGVANFAAATGADIPEAAQLAGSALRGFGLDASEMDRVVSVLGVATTKTALDFQKLQTGLSTVAPVANAFGFSIEDTTALLGQLSNAGFDASSAATATRNILLNLADANGDLAQELGGPIESADDLAVAFATLEAKGVDLGTALELTDKRSVAAFETFLKGSGDLIGLRDSITDVNDELQAMADKKLNTIGGQFTLLQSAWEGFILSANEGSGAGLAIKNVLGFLAQNLGTIVVVLGKVIRAFIAFKTVMFALKLKEQYKDFRLAGGSIKNMGKNLDGASAGAKKFGGALKSIGVGVAVALFVEFAAALWNIVSGASRAADELRRLNGIEAKGETVRKNFNKQFKRSLSDRNKLRLDAIRHAKEDAKISIRSGKSTAEAMEAQKEAIKAANDEFLLFAQGKKDPLGRSLVEQQTMQIGNLRQQLRLLEQGLALDKKIKNDARRQSQVFNTKVDIKNKINEIKLLSSEILLRSEAVDKIKEENKEKEVAKEIIPVGPKVELEVQKEINTEFQNSINLLGKYNDLMKDRRKLEEDISQINQSKAISSLDDEIKLETDTQSRTAETTGQIDVDAVEALVNKKGELRKAAINQETAFEIQELRIKLETTQAMRKEALQIEYENLINGAEGNAEAIEKINANHQTELSKLKVIEELELGNLGKAELKITKETKEEILEVKRETSDEIEAINDQLIQEQINYATKQGGVLVTAAKKAADAESNMWQERMDIAQVATDFLTLLSDKRMKKIDDEISKAETQADFLRTLAANGNIDAKDSLAEQQQIIDEANRKKIQEEKLKAKIEFANTVFQTYGAKVQAGSASPLADTIKDVSLLQQFVAQFTPTFKDGTEDTGSHGQGIDGQGGFHAILHPNERVLTKEQNKAVGGLSNDSLAKVAQDYQNGKIMQEGASQIGQGWDTSIVVKRLESLEQTIKDKPEHSLRVEDVVTGALTIVRETKEGNTLNYNRYRIRK